MAKIRVLVTSGHEIVRIGLRQLLKTAEAFEVVGQTDTHALLGGFQQLSPDVVLVELSQPAMALPCIAKLLKTVPDARVVVLSTNENASFIRSILATGAWVCSKSRLRFGTVSGFEAGWPRPSLSRP